MSHHPGTQAGRILKEQYLYKHTNVRLEGYAPTPPGRLPIDGLADVKDILRGMGVEILSSVGRVGELTESDSSL